MSFTLPDLPFDKEALKEWTSSETLDFHHGKRHAGYVKKLNAAVEGTEWAEKSVEEIIAGNRNNPAIFNSAAQHFNHSFFWNCIKEESDPVNEKLQELIDRDFGSFDEFKEKFSELAAKHFGSGWIWLVQDGDGKLLIKDYHDADTPTGTNLKPILTLDVWEHAYYIDHRNDRAAFIEGFWEHVNWSHANSQLI
jgi:superoxide dismutase, Fe-Mn family